MNVQFVFLKKLISYILYFVNLKKRKLNYFFKDSRNGGVPGICQMSQHWLWYPFTMTAYTVAV